MNPMNSPTDAAFARTAVIDHFEGMHAVLKMEGGEQVRWPVKRLPDGAREGTAVRLTLSTAPSEEAEPVQAARAMLNEVLRAPE